MTNSYSKTDEPVGSTPAGTGASERLARRFESFSAALSLLVLLLGAAVIIGWLFDITFLKSVLPDLPAMKMNLAVGFILLAASLWMVQPQKSHIPVFRSAARCCSWIAIAIGALTLVEYIAGWDLGIDELLKTEGPGALYNTHPGRPSPLAALNLVLTGIAILAIDVRAGGGVRPGHVALLVAGITSLLTFIGHINGIPHFLRFIPGSSAIAFHATLAFLALTAGILFARPTQGVTAILISGSAGGVLARRVLLPAVIIMPVLDYAVTASVSAGYLDVSSEGAVHTTWLMVFITGMVVGTARLLEKADLRRTQAEAESARLANAVKHAGDAVIITDAKGRIEYVNPAFEAITGYRIEEVRGQNPRFLKSGRHDSAFYDNLWQTVRKGMIWRGNMINRRKDGSLYEEEMIVSPITGAAGAILNYVAVQRDVTREAALHRSRGYFTTIVSHELRTPLTNLRLMETLLQQIEAAGAAGERVEYLRGALLKTIASFDRIVDATTLIAEMSHTGGEKPFSRNTLHRHVAKSLAEARESIAAEKRNINIEDDLWDLPHQTTVLGSGAMIERALEEVLSNAIKFTPDGRSIRVRKYVRDHSVHIEVADAGTGIPEEQLRDVLIPYYSLENPLNHTTGRYNFLGGGLGLGLTIVKLIMDYHDGALLIGNRSDSQGASVILSFPLAPGHEPTVAA